VKTAKEHFKTIASDPYTTAPKHPNTEQQACRPVQGAWRQEVVEAPAQALALWKWAPSALPQAQRPDNARFRVFRPRVFAIFA